MSASLERYETEQNARIYRIPIDLFPELRGFVHVALFDEFCVLFDVGSGFGSSNEQLEEGLQQVRSLYGEQVNWSTITHIIISHGHIDHFGGVKYARSKCNAPVIVHSLDRRVLTNYEERLTLIAQKLEEYLVEAGLTPERIEGIMSMYMLNKGLFESQPIDLLCEQLGMKLGRMEWLHVPGHCPGQIVALLDNVLLSADHVLETTSPHQAPESLSLSTGLNHYLGSLAKLRPYTARISLTLGGHEGPVHDLETRLFEIVQVHRERLLEILMLTREACTVGEISQRLFPDVEGYHQLLAIEEAGAHVEFLQQRGFLTVANFGEVERVTGAPIFYERPQHVDTARLDACLSALDSESKLSERTARIVS